MIKTDLSLAQAEAVLCDSQQILLLAAAGSGKTFTLVSRIAYLIENGASPREILCITFSRRAAREMRARLERTLGEQSNGITVNTFHGLALSLLNDHGHLAGFREGEPISIYEETIADHLMERTCADLGHIGKNGKWRGGLSGEKVRRYREAMATEGCAPKENELELNAVLGIIFQEYRSRLRRNNAVDYGLCLSEALALLNLEKVRSIYNDRYKHLHLDEGQDTDQVQFFFVAKFSPPATLFVVGDARQSIYSWRGARPDLLISGAK